MKKLAEDLWILPYSLRLLGGDLRRMVTIVRLRSGELVIHSTGPFAPEDVAAILALVNRVGCWKSCFDTTLFPSKDAKPFPGSPFWHPKGLAR
jgi:hypothetical protein